MEGEKGRGKRRGKREEKRKGRGEEKRGKGKRKGKDPQCFSEKSNRAIVIRHMALLA